MAAAASFGCESEEDRVAELVRDSGWELITQPGESTEERRKRMQEVLAPVLDDAVEVVIPWFDLEGPESEAFALGAATEVNHFYPIGDVAFEALEVRLSPSRRRASVLGMARVSSSQPGDLHAFDVRFEIDLRKDTSAWRITRIVLDRPAQDLPEARP